MIIQSLISYYDRLSAQDAVPPFGFSIEDIGFVITINKNGSIIGDPIDVRTKIKADVYNYLPSITPYSNKVNARSSNASKTSNFMVDKADYIFGMSGTAPKKQHHESFKTLINEVCSESKDVGVMAIKAFLENWEPDKSIELAFWKEICGINGKWIAFQLEGERRFIHERPDVQKNWINYISKEKYEKGFSFVDGNIQPLQPQYAQFKFGSGAALVSFNENAYESYGKKRGENAPISVEAEFKSSSALKYLLRSKMQRIKIADATTLFWTERTSPVEIFMGQILNPQNDMTDNIPLQKFLEAAKKGTNPQELDYKGEVKFYVLGLSLNKARLAVRFWHVCTVEQLSNRIGRHFNDLEMERKSEKDIQFPGIWHLLKETARETKDIPPLLGGALMRSILEGVNYPQNLFNGVLNRIRADQQINYLRASALKGILNRNFKMEVPMSLDTEKKDIAYLLGRLFAILEKAQQDAIPGAKTTIKDRFYGAASTTPASIFPRLLKLSAHHIEKAKYGHISDKRISEIMEHIDDFPNHLDLKQQGLFAIAYYQQKNAISREIKEAAAKTMNDTKGEIQ
jgi:CRISPR-associated protein Csd1